MLASKTDLKKLADRIEKNMKKNTGVDEKEACNIVRSAIRQTWMRHPVRTLAVDLATVVDEDPKTRTKWLVKCARCEKFHKKCDVQTDHIKGEHSLKTLDDIPSFVLSILDVTTDDLQVLCKPCHRIKTYAERYDHSEEDAETILNAKDWISSKSVSTQKQVFKDLGYPPESYSNAKKRESIAISEKLSI